MFIIEKNDNSNEFIFGNKKLSRESTRIGAYWFLGLRFCVWVGFSAGGIYNS